MLISGYHCATFSINVIFYGVFMLQFWHVVYWFSQKNIKLQ